MVLKTYINVPVQPWDIPSPNTNINDLNEFDLEIPDNSNLLPPGYYMLFVVTGLSDIPGTNIPRLGVPSIGEIIQILPEECEE